VQFNYALGIVIEIIIVMTFKKNIRHDQGTNVSCLSFCSIYYKCEASSSTGW